MKYCIYHWPICESRILEERFYLNSFSSWNIQNDYNWYGQQILKSGTICKMLICILKSGVIWVTYAINKAINNLLKR